MTNHTTPAMKDTLVLPDGWELADHPRHGRVIVTRPTPDADGNVYFVAPAANLLGYDWRLCKHEELTYIDTEPEEA